MFFSTGVAGLILLTGTDLLLDEWLVAGMTTATIIMCIRALIQVLYSVIYLTLQEYQQVQEVIITCMYRAFLYILHKYCRILQRSLRCICLLFFNHGQHVVIFGIVTCYKGVSFGAIEPVIQHDYSKS